MDRKIKHLAYCRKVEAEYQAAIDEAEAELKDSDLWHRLKRQGELLAVAKADVADAEADIRKAASAEYTVLEIARLGT